MGHRHVALDLQRVRRPRAGDVSLNVRARKEMREEKFLGLTLAIDSLTGASPSGAAPPATVQTFTSPSGNSQYTVARGRAAARYVVPRHAHGARRELGDAGRRALRCCRSARASRTSTTTRTRASMRASRATSTTATRRCRSVLALAERHDQSRRRQPRAARADAGSRQTTANKRGDQSKDVTDFLIGVTQVLNRHTIVQLNYSLSQADGYLTDPYKMLSVVDPVTGDPVAGPPAAADAVSVREPSRRRATSKASTALVKRDFDGDVLEASYRYMTDDWGVDSHTRRAALSLEFRRAAILSAARALLPADGGGLLSHRVVRRRAAAAVRDGGSPARRVRRASRSA